MTCPAEPSGEDVVPRRNRQRRRAEHSAPGLRPQSTLLAPGASGFVEGGGRASTAPLPPFAAPPLMMMLMEQAAVFEMMSLWAASPWLHRLERGEPHPVLVLPGFIVGDSSTLPLRTFINSWGYWANTSGSRGNAGPSAASLAQVRQRLVDVHRRYEHRVTLVGSSMGGMMARLLAREYPALVRQVITLASPLQLTVGDRSSVSFISDRLRHRFDPEFGRRPDHDLGPL